MASHRARVIGTALLVLSSARPARALTFNVTYRASTASAPAGFFTAFAYAVQYYQSMYNDPITINVQVGWGEINGSALAPGNLGQSLTNQPAAFTYAQVRSALIADAKTPEDLTAVGTLPASDPTGGRSFYMSNAEAKALGLLAANAAGTDGWIGFSSTASWTYDPNARAASGTYDFIGLAHHELTEVMGRYGYHQNGSVNGNSPIDLFRYSSTGTRDLSPSYSANNSTANYFSIDAGQTDLHDFNVTCNGADLSDWANTQVDAFSTCIGSGVKLGTSPGDRIEMDALGYDRVLFTDTTLVSGVTPIKAVHLVELRTRIDAARARHGLSAYAYSRALAAGQLVRASDVLETRAALNEVYTAAGVAIPVYSTTPAPGGPISRADIADLRAALESIEDG